jgi:Tfp pilus assembly protein PilO
MHAVKSPPRDAKDFPNKYLNSYQPESTAKQHNNELILIKALRKELAAKNKTLAELKKQLPTQDMSGFAADNSNNTIIVGAG